MEAQKSNTQLQYQIETLQINLNQRVNEKDTEIQNLTD